LRYTSRQIEQYRRRKYISLLEKTLKRLYKIFKNPASEPSELRNRLQNTIAELEKLEDLRLDSEHARHSESYLRELYGRVRAEEFDAEAMEEMRDEQLGALNRLQKMKNRNSYSRSRQNRRAATERWED